MRMASDPRGDENCRALPPMRRLFLVRCPSGVSPLPFSRGNLQLYTRRSCACVIERLQVWEGKSLLPHDQTLHATFVSR